MNKLVEITEPKEMEKFVKSSNYLLVDDGLDEYVIHESDLVDYFLLMIIKVQSILKVLLITLLLSKKLMN